MNAIEAVLLVIRFAAVGMFGYGLLWDELGKVLLALLVWEVGTGFRGSTILWFLDATRK